MLEDVHWADFTVLWRAIPAEARRDAVDKLRKLCRHLFRDGLSAEIITSGITQRLYQTRRTWVGRKQAESKRSPTIE
jgi:hypothetical protein